MGETEEEVEGVPFYRLPMAGMDRGGRIEAGRWRRRPCSGRTATGPSWARAADSGNAGATRHAVLGADRLRAGSRGGGMRLA